jgi:hypothetical protein
VQPTTVQARTAITATDTILGIEIPHRVYFGVRADPTGTAE